LFLAVIRGGSFLAAARALNVAVSTVSRRIAALERRMDTVLLERRTDGAVATDAGRALGALAERVALDLAATLRDVAPVSKSLKGTIRISAGDGFTVAIADCIAKFSEQHPDVEFELVVESRVANLHKREADIAVRTVHRQEPSLVYARLGELNYALWASAEYLRKCGTPESLGELRAHRFIGFSAPLDKHAAVRWLRSLGARQITVRANTFRAQFLAAQKGTGIAALPRSAVRNLIEVLPGIAPLSLPLFFVSHPQSLRRPQVRAFADLLIADLRARLA